MLSPVRPASFFARRCASSFLMLSPIDFYLSTSHYTYSTSPGDRSQRGSDSDYEQPLRGHGEALAAGRGNGVLVLDAGDADAGEDHLRLDREDTARFERIREPLREDGPFVEFEAEAVAHVARAIGSGAHEDVAVAERL